MFLAQSGLMSMSLVARSTWSLPWRAGGTVGGRPRRRGGRCCSRIGIGSERGGACPSSKPPAPRTVGYRGPGGRNLKPSLPWTAGWISWVGGRDFRGGSHGWKLCGRDSRRIWQTGEIHGARGKRQNRSADRGPAAVPVPARRPTAVRTEPRHRAPRARALGTLARAPSRSRANGAAAPTQAGTVAPAAVTQGPRPPTPGPGVTLGSARTEGATGGSSRGWDARLGDPRGWKERLRRDCGMRAAGGGRLRDAWIQIREDGRSGEAAGCGAAAGCAAGAAAGVRGTRARQNVRQCWTPTLLT
jgi:hypothetical protein